MRVVNNINEICKSILKVAKYQKVIFCVDNTSDISLIEQIEKRLNRQVLGMKYYYNNNDIATFHQMLNGGARAVIYNVDLQNYYKLHKPNNYILNISIPTSSFILPYLSNGECVYGENMLVGQFKDKDWAGIIQLYYAGLRYVWEALQRNENIEMQIFKDIDNLTNQQEFDVYKFVELNNILRPYTDNEYFNVSEQEFPFYVYIKLYSICNMLTLIYNGEEQYIDFYKTKEPYSVLQKAHDVIVKYELINLIKFYNEKLIKINHALLNRCKILIKKYFKIKNIKLENLNNIIKNTAKHLKLDNLLFISYILNAV